MKKYSAPLRAFTIALFGLSAGPLAACGGATGDGTQTGEDTGKTIMIDQVTNDSAPGRQTPPPVAESIHTMDNACTNADLANATVCDGNQPMICDGAVWQTNGGACAYGCTAGACVCSAPTGRLTAKTCTQCSLVEDAVTGLRWYHNDGDWGPSQWDQAGEKCGFLVGENGASGRLPTVAEVKAVLAEEAPALHCTPDHDPLFPTANLWTQDASAAGHIVVNTADGTTAETADTSFKTVWCILP